MHINIAPPMILSSIEAYLAKTKLVVSRLERILRNHVFYIARSPKRVYRKSPPQEKNQNIFVPHTTI